MNVFFSSLVLLGTALSQGQGDPERIFTVEVCRHCERESSVLFNYAKNPEEEFKVASNCTEVGVDHHNLNGLGLRLWLESFLSIKYDPSEVYT